MIHVVATNYASSSLTGKCQQLMKAQLILQISGQGGVLGGENARLGLCSLA